MRHHGAMAMLLYWPGKSVPRLVGSRRSVTTENSVDTALVARIAAADRTALRILYVRHHPRIRRFVRQFVENEHVADALAHDVFLHVWRNADRFSGRGPVSTWLLCVARQKTITAASPGGPMRKWRAASSEPRMNITSTEGSMP
jgi:RNA polymerase sigma-70 factor (ECF subfamily)